MGIYSLVIIAMLPIQLWHLVDAVPSIISVIENPFRAYWIPWQRDQKKEEDTVSLFY